MDRTTKATRISINVKPFDFLKSPKASPPENGFGFGEVFAKPVPMGSDYWKKRDRGTKLHSSLNMLGPVANKLREEHMPLAFPTVYEKFKLTKKRLHSSRIS
jgi:hypothetical protein